MFTTHQEQEFFFKELNIDKKVLEYGSGSSTSEICSRVKLLVSIEHQKDWFEKTKSQDLPNTIILLKEPNIHYEEGKHCGTYEEFKDYIEAPLEYAPFDIILIDGRARVACSSFCKNLAHENTVIFVHDFERNEYNEIHDYLQLIDRVENMAKFKLKI